MNPILLADPPHRVDHHDPMETALQPGASFGDIGAAADHVAALAAQAVTSSSANDELQRLVYDLYFGPEEATHALRQWLATFANGYFASTAEPYPSAGLDDLTAFDAALDAVQGEWQPQEHPLFLRTCDPASPHREFDHYLHQKWIIMLTFWRSISEFGQRLQRLPGLTNPSLIYKNVSEELGEGDVTRAHLVRHLQLLEHIGVPARWDDRPTFTSTFEYINFRMFCVRHLDPRWGAGSFYSQEATSLDYTLVHYDKLRQRGISHEAAGIYYDHEEIDDEHTDEIRVVIDGLSNHAEARATVLTAQRHQMLLWYRHFDDVLAALDA